MPAYMLVSAVVSMRRQTGLLVVIFLAFTFLFLLRGVLTLSYPPSSAHDDPRFSLLTTTETATLPLYPAKDVIHVVAHGCFCFYPTG